MLDLEQGWYWVSDYRGKLYAAHYMPGSFGIAGFLSVLVPGSCCVVADIDIKHSYHIISSIPKPAGF